jgi:hypothetical protein
MPLGEMERLVAAHLPLGTRGPSLDAVLTRLGRTASRWSASVSAAWGALKEEVEAGP